MQVIFSFYLRFKMLILLNLFLISGKSHDFLRFRNKHICLLYVVKSVKLKYFIIHKFYILNFLLIVHFFIILVYLLPIIQRIFIRNFYYLEIYRFKTISYKIVLLPVHFNQFMEFRVISGFNTIHHSLYVFKAFFRFFITEFWYYGFTFFIVVLFFAFVHISTAFFSKMSNVIGLESS